MPTVFFLRHEARPLGDSTYKTELFNSGKRRAATSLCDILSGNYVEGISLIHDADNSVSSDSNNDKMNYNSISNPGISTVYSSPFLRVLQTIGPFCKKHNIQPRVDYALSEFAQDPNFNDVENGKDDIRISDEIIKEFNCNKEWIDSSDNSISHCGYCDRNTFRQTGMYWKTNGNKPESPDNIFERSKKFAAWLIINHGIDFTHEPGSNVLIASHMDNIKMLIPIFQRVQKHMVNRVPPVLPSLLTTLETSSSTNSSSNCIDNDPSESPSPPTTTTYIPDPNSFKYAKKGHVLTPTFGSTVSQIKAREIAINAFNGTSTSDPLLLNWTNFQKGGLSLPMKYLYGMGCVSTIGGCSGELILLNQGVMKGTEEE